MDLLLSVVSVEEFVDWKDGKTLMNVFVAISI